MKAMLIMIAIAILFNFLDMVSGLISAIKNKTVESSKLRDGLFKKVGFVLCYILGFLVDTQGPTIGLNLGADILPVIILFAVMTEITSIIENICNINPEILPETLKKIFKLEVK